MTYASVAIVFAAVFVVYTLAAASMSGVFSIGAKKTALTEQPQRSRGCQVEKPSDAGKQSKCLSPAHLWPAFAYDHGNPHSPVAEWWAW